MIITKKAIPRRMVLRGIGASLALPLLDGMVPALSAMAQSPARRVHRLSTVYVPNGIVMDHWTPAAEGAGFEFTTSLKPLERFRERLVVLSGLRSKTADEPGGGPHSRGSTAFMTDTASRRTQGAEDLQAGVSIDQLVAKELSQHTQLRSLELALEGTDFGGSCDVGFSCAYVNTISWSSPTTPLPMENNPRAVFERLFGDAGTTDAKVRLERLARNRSILDSVTSKVATLGRGLGPGDRGKLDEYLEAVRDVERRIQQAERQNATALPMFAQPAGVPASYADHAKVMFDLQVLAYQTDLTRVITFMLGREFSGLTYPEIGVPDAHHPTSHHQKDPAKLAKLVKINTYHATLLAYYLEKLQSTPDGDGSLLDNMTMIYGSGISDGNSHSHNNLPVLLLGGGAGQLKGGRHLKYPGDTPLANMHVSVLQKFGLAHEVIGDSTGALAGI